MAGVNGVFGSVLHRNQRVSSSSQPFDSFFVSGSSSSFLGSSSMVSFEDACGGKRSERSFFCTYDPDENGEDEYDDYFHQPEKKRRLTCEQVRFLEKSFETENKLDPERKVQLAKELGLQPRQVAIWFQNRRARWKNKQLEKDFDILQASYNSLKGDYDSLFKEKEKLQAEVVLLTGKLLHKEKERGCNSEPSNLFDQQSKNDQTEPNVDSTSESKDHHLPIIVNKQEDLSSIKSDGLESESSHHVDWSRNSIIQPYDSSYPLEADHSDISQDDDDYLNKSLLPSSGVFPKMVGVHYSDPPADASNFGLADDDHASLFWPCWNTNLKM